MALFSLSDMKAFVTVIVSCYLGSNPSLPHCRQTLYHLSHQGSPEEYAAAATKSLQSCLTLCDPMDYSVPGSSIHGIFQATVLEWGATAFSPRGV